MSGHPFRGRAAIVGVGASIFDERGASSDSEFDLTLNAMLSAAEDAGIDPHRIDGFASFNFDRTDPSRMAAALCKANSQPLMCGRPLSPEAYEQSRWIVEPHHLYDCCMEDDCAAAVIVMNAEAARDLKPKPAFILGAAQGSEYRNQARIHNAPHYASASFSSVAPRLLAQAGGSPADVDVTQCCENFTGGVLMSLIEYGFCAPEEANALFTLENLSAPSGRLPLNTSGGNLAEACLHGMGHILEGVREIRGTSTSQGPDAQISFVGSGPMVSPVSDILLGSENIL
jgi:acetyl-CoA acetyltransferase